MTQTANYTRRFQQPHRRFRAGATLSAAITLLILASHPARAEDFVWQGVGCTNAWFAFCNQGECSPGVTLRVNGWGRNACSPATPAVPAAGDRIFINAGLTLVQNGSASILQLNIPATSQLHMVNGATLDLTGTPQNNSGIIIVNSAGGFGASTLQFSANSSLTGSGVVRMSAANADAQVNTIGAAILTNAAGHSIAGRGQINANLVNNGFVSADVGGHVLHLLSNNKTNNALMNALNSGFLDITGITITQGANGEIAANNATVRMQGGSTIIGGKITSPNSGVFSIENGTNTLTNILNEADLRIVNGRILQLSGTFTNNNRVLVNTAGGFGQTTLQILANLTMNGSGRIDMNAANADATLDTAAGITLTQASTHTIRGRGYLNANLINNGLVSADVGGHVLHLRDKNKTNNATMQATNSSFLDIVGITVNQGANGELLADGGTVRLQGDATVQGGKMRSTGSSVISIENGTNTLTNILNEADLRIVNGRTLQLNGTFTNNNRVLVNTAGGFGGSTLQILANLTLNGSGRIDMNAANADATLDTAAGITLTQASTHTIRGRGHLNANLVNNGLVSADVGGHVLHLRDKNKTNNATMQATNSSFLDIVGITVNQGANGEILADGGTVRLQGDATIQGGKLRSVGDFAITVENGTNTLQVVRNEAAVRIVNGRTLQIASSPFQNAGTVLVNTAGGFGVSTLAFLDNTTLSASGSIIMNAANTEATLSVAANKTLTQAPAHTIRGRGTISIDATGRLVNNGTIRADVGGHTLFISNGNRLDNRGTVAVNTGCFMSATGGYVQTAGNTNVNGTMTVNSGPMEIQDGILSGVGIINGTVVLSNNAQLSPGNSPGTLTINGNYTQGPDNTYLVEIAGRSAGQWDRVAVNGTSPNGVATLDGVLEVALLDGFQPQLGDRFIIMTHRARVGKFSDWVLPNAPDGTRWTVGYFPDRVVLSVTCTSDVNGDGSINDDDLLAILLAFGTDDKSADVNQDGIVNDIDLLLVLLAFGEACQ
ncbi:MAG: hypothetical protein KIT45_04895 [Fimbriimonadia bacterium]|nr:hypothetical protein [Fimbriimonadia bacterium]